MEKYGDIIMNQRIVANKHVYDHTLVSAAKFKSLGEIFISNEPEYEGIYVINTNNEVVRVASNPIVSAMTPEERIIREIMESYLPKYYLSSAQTVEYVSEVAGEINSRIDETNGRIDGVEVKLAEESGRTDSLFERVEVIEGGLAETSGNVENLDERVTALEVSGTPSPIDEETVRRLADEEISKYITSAGTVLITDHVFLTREQYDELVREGHAIIDGKYVVYSDSVYYCIYEGEPTPTEETEADFDEESGTITLFGEVAYDEINETIIVNGVDYDEDEGIMTFPSVRE